MNTYSYTNGVSDSIIIDCSIKNSTLSCSSEEAYDIYERFKLANATSSFKRLAAWLNVPEYKLKKARKGGLIPIEWLQTLTLKGGVYSASWVISGDKNDLRLNENDPNVSQ